jgi:hypothetical protein
VDKPQPPANRIVCSACEKEYVGGRPSCKCKLACWLSLLLFGVGVVFSVVFMIIKCCI